MTRRRQNGRTNSDSGGALRPGDIELLTPDRDFPYLSGKKHTERHPSRILRYGLAILGGGIGLALGPLYLFAKDFGIADVLKRQDLTGVYLLACYLGIIGLAGILRWRKRRSRGWMDR
ncbi:MAG TPA: hypothetical protein VIV61_05480 [Candidatus Ozemobacteraceae bacterium]